MFPSLRLLPCRRHSAVSQSAFTLLELMVVLVLVSIMMAVSIPNFRSSIVTDPLKRSARQVIGVVREARQQAAQSPLGCRLVIDIEAGIFGLSCPQRPEQMRAELTIEEDEDYDIVEDEEDATEPVKLLTLAEPSRIRSIWNGSSSRFTIGEVTLWITADGIMEPSVINLSDGRDELGLSIFPFITDIRVDDKAAVPEDYRGSEVLL